MRIVGTLRSPNRTGNDRVMSCRWTLLQGSARTSFASCTRRLNKAGVEDSKVVWKVCFPLWKRPLLDLVLCCALRLCGRDVAFFKAKCFSPLSKETYSVHILSRNLVLEFHKVSGSRRTRPSTYSTPRASTSATQ